MEIKFETEETVVLREGSKVSVDHCRNCDRSVLMATPETAAFLSGLSERQIFRRLETGDLHFTENGRVLICLESVKAVDHLRMTPVTPVCTDTIDDEHKGIDRQNNKTIVVD